VFLGENEAVGGERGGLS